MQQTHRQSHADNIEALHNSNCLPVISGVIAVLALLFFMAIESTMDWASHTVLAGLWGFFATCSGILFFVCASVTGWHVYVAKTTHKRYLDKEQEQILLLHQTSKLISKAPEYGYTVYIEQTYQADGTTLKSTQIKAVMDAQARREHAKQQIVESEAPAGLLTAGQGAAESKVDTRPVFIPITPNFWDIVDLIQTDRIPLCFVVDANENSPTYKKTIPVFGTIQDLLSLIIIGKPGRGKSVFLLYYACILLKHGTEVHLLDPQGAFKDLELLSGKELPFMPKTARIYYYSEIEEMEKAVVVISDEIKVREKLYKPHLENGKLKKYTLKHPLAILADELPIISEIDAEIRERTKEENRERKEEGLPLKKTLQVVRMIKTSVLAARKYDCYFFGASQSIDHTILPTRVTAGFNSRIAFLNTEQKMRQVGMETETIKRFLPALRKVGPGFMIYDCGRWAEALLATIPFITIDDMLVYFGIDPQELEAQWIAELTAQEQEILSDVDGVTVTTPHLQIVQSEERKPRATLEDAIAVWNEAQKDTERKEEMGRPQLREELQKRGLYCSDYLSDQLLKAIKRKIDREKLA